MNKRKREGVRGGWTHADTLLHPSQMYWAAALHTYTPLPLLGRGGSISDKFRLHAFVNTGNIGDFVLSECYGVVLCGCWGVLSAVGCVLCCVIL